MRLRNIYEGGWDTTVTQGTVIKPATVAIALDRMSALVKNFNDWLSSQGMGPVEIGRPTGSGSYHKQDAAEDPDKIYGDIDLQMVGPPSEGMTQYQYATHWNKLFDQYLNLAKPRTVHPTEGKVGHPIIEVGPDQWVQVDLMWHEPRLRSWGAARTTPQRGVKGLLMGNLFSVLGELLDMSIQHAGVQMKTLDGQHVPFAKQKGVTTHTLSIDPRNFLADIFRHEVRSIRGGDAEDAEMDPLLSANPGINPDDVKISDMVSGIKGLAASMERAGLFGQGNLSDYADAGEFLDRFMERYEGKAMGDIASSKRSKADTPEAKARAEADRQKVLDGFRTVKALFTGTSETD